MREILRATKNDPNSYALPRALILEVLIVSTSCSFRLSLTRTSFSIILSRERDLTTAYSPVYQHRIEEQMMQLPYTSTLEIALQHCTLRCKHQPRMAGYKDGSKRKSNTYVVMATLIGVCIAVMLGVLGLAVSTFQAWVAYQQWKHPVKDS
jgi:hypothetical protein